LETQPTALPQITEFERRLSAVIAESGLSAFDAIVAIGISMARVLYGLEVLQGKQSAFDACDLLDQTMVKAWRHFTAKPQAFDGGERPRHLN
jgi:hypothetical protein